MSEDTGLTRLSHPPFRCSAKPNPRSVHRYGIVCMIGLFALPMSYIIYEKPQFFVFGLLALNGCGVIIVTEYITVEYSRRLNFDSAPYRVGKALTALCVSLAIVAIFQFLLRNPARRQVRKALAKCVIFFSSSTLNCARTPS